MAHERTDPTPVIPNLERGLLILEYLSRHSEGRGISEIAAALDYPLNSVFRVTNTLLKHGYVERNPQNKKFTLSRKLFSLAYGSESDRNLMENALDLMRELRDRVRETVVVSIIDRGEGLILEQVPGLHLFRFVVEPGARQVLHTSASCKAILAFLPDAERDGILAGIRFTKLTSRTISDRGEFEAELDRVRASGYAVDRGEALDGVHCVAAAVRDQQGRAIAAITVTGPSTRMTEKDFGRIGPLVRDVAARISARFGFGLNGNGSKAAGGNGHGRAKALGRQHV
jgi:DNA-binding IclR family transcriptional regulator